MLLKFEQNRMVQTTQNFELFDKNRVFYKLFFFFLTDAIVEDVSEAETLGLNENLP